MRQASSVSPELCAGLEEYPTEKQVPTELRAVSGSLLPIVKTASSKLSVVLAQTHVSGPKRM